MGSSFQGQSSANSEIADAAVLAELDRILRGSAFSKVERPSRFLRHLVQTALRNEPQLLKESVLGMDVFDRRPDWDPRLDPVVRQEAARLRKRLARHYESDDSDSGIRIELPVGTYVPVFRMTASAVPPPEIQIATESTLPVSRRRSRRIAGWAALGLAGLLVVGTVIASRMPARRVLQPNHEAREFYLQGLHEWQKRSPESLARAVDLFTQAIVREPRYASAYVGLANCYNLLREFSAMSEREAYPRALAATQKALELDDGSAEAHASLAFISFWWNWNAALAEREFRRALELNPDYGTAHHWYATFLSTRGRHAEALEQIEAAQKLDPASVSVIADKGLLLYLAGRKTEAKALLKQIQTEAPNLRSVHRYIADIDLLEGNNAEYLVEARRSAEVAQDASALAVVTAAEKGYANGGARAMLERMLETQIRLHGEGRTGSYVMAQTATLLRKMDDAAAYLDAASREPGSLFLGYRVDLMLANFRQDPRYQTLDARFEPGINSGTIAPPR